MIPFLLLACDDYPMVPKTDAPDPCTRSDAALAWDEETDLGIPEDLALEGVFTQSTTLTWSDGTPTDLAIAVTVDGVAAPHWYEAVGSDPMCFGQEVTLPLRLSFVTADGAFTEDVGVEMSAFEDGVGMPSQPYIPAAEHVGSYDVSGWDEVNLAFGAWNDQSAGEIVLIREDDLGGECGVAAWGQALQTGCGA